MMIPLFDPGHFQIDLCQDCGSTLWDANGIMV
jgi:hypothetical protein